VCACSGLPPAAPIPRKGQGDPIRAACEVSHVAQATAGSTSGSLPSEMGSTGRVHRWAQPSSRSPRGRVTFPENICAQHNWRFRPVVPPRNPVITCLWTPRERSTNGGREGRQPERVQYARTVDSTDLPSSGDSAPLELYALGYVPSRTSDTELNPHGFHDRWGLFGFKGRHDPGAIRHPSAIERAPVPENFALTGPLFGA
jgi:hypothetical protein